jgi:transposase
MNGAGIAKEANVSKLWLGVDVAKANFVAATSGEQEETLGSFENQLTGFEQLAQALLHAAASHEIHLVIEPTGGYELALVAFAYEQGWQVTLPNPKQVRDWAKGTGRRTKTDRQDAQLLARYGATCQPEPQAALPSEVSELDSLLKRRRDLEQMLQQETNRLQELRGRPGIAAPVFDNLAQVQEALQEALRQVEEAISAHLQHHVHLHQAQQRLLSVPGIGPKIVLPLLVLLYRWQTLTQGEGSAKGLTALVGLDPKTHVSGRTVYRHPAISKMGNAEVRRLLYMGALSAVHGHNPLHIFYERLVGRGKVRKLAVVAAARKLLTWAWTIFIRQSTWNPQLHAL